MFESAERVTRRPTSYASVTSPETTPSERPPTLDYNQLLKQHERELKYGGKQRVSLPTKIGMTATALLMLGTGAHSIDTRLNRIEAAESQPALKTLSQEYVTDETSTIFYLAGFDTRNGDAFGQKVGVAIHQIIPGIDASVDYGNAPLEPEEIAKKIIGYVGESEDTETISIAGNSLGGLVSAKVAEYIILNSHIEVASVIFNATPNGSKGLRPETQGELASLIDTFDALEVLDAKHSTLARYAVTLAQEHGRFINEDGILDPIALWETSGTTWERINENRVPGMWLVVDQASAVTNIDLEEATQNIGEQRGTKRMPVYVVLRTTNPEDDQVVSVVESANDTCDYAHAAHISCHILHVDGAHHTSYLFDTEAYTKAIAASADSIKDDIDAEATEYALLRQDIWAAENYGTDPTP